MSENSFQSEVTAKAAESGANASARFRERQAQAGSQGVVDHERVDLLAGKAIKALNDLIVEEQLSYEEYNAFKAWLIKVGDDGEWPLFLDVWIEHEIEQRGAGQPEPLGARADGVEADLAQQHVGREVVARGTDQRREIGHRKRGGLQVLPDAAVADRVARRLVEDGEPAGVALGDPRRQLDEQQDLADARRRQGDALVDRGERFVRVEVDHRRRDLGAVVGDLPQRRETRREVGDALDRAMTRRTRPAYAISSLRRRREFYQMVTRSFGSSQRASVSLRSNARENSSILRTIWLQRNSFGECGSMESRRSASS